MFHGLGLTGDDERDGPAMTTSRGEQVVVRRADPAGILVIVVGDVDRLHDVGKGSGLAVSEVRLRWNRLAYRRGLLFVSSPKPNERIKHKFGDDLRQPDQVLTERLRPGVFYE